jgi:hypothetical protein
MNPETREFRASAHRWFGALVAVQAAHSVEESVFGLYDLLPYIRWMDDVFEGGAFTLFVTLNTLFVLFGAWAYLARVRPLVVSLMLLRSWKGAEPVRSMPA